MCLWFSGSAAKEGSHFRQHVHNVAACRTRRMRNASKENVNDLHSSHRGEGGGVYKTLWDDNVEVKV